MGTRSATGIRIDGADKLSYNQFDGYPSGVGNDILKELKERFSGRDYDDVVGELKQKARTARLVDESVKPTEADIRKMMGEGAVDLSVSRQSTEDWYCLCRGHQGSILQRLDCGVFIDSNAFIYDSLFCEYAYILNLDDETLEFYNGFQNAPHDHGRYGRSEARDRKQEYFGCALVKAYPLKEFLAFDDASTLEADLENFEQTSKLAAD